VGVRTAAALTRHDGAVSEVRNNTEKSRFEIFVDDRRVGFMTYHVDGDTVVTPHTEVDVEHGGRGHGKELVRGALDSIRADGRFVEPLCPFVRSYIRRHPDYQDLVKGS
jgi:uncharacterized protein